MNIAKIEYVEDCKHIASIALKNGYELSLRQAQDIWRDYSHSMAAGWLILGEDDEVILRIVRRVAEPSDESFFQK
jgi:hypothetical protein